MKYYDNGKTKTTAYAVVFVLPYYSALAMLDKVAVCLAEVVVTEEPLIGR